MAARRASAADGMIAAGVLLSSAAVGALAGLWWAVLLLGAVLVAGGVVKGRHE